jgi:hypothetical protein
MTARTRVLCLFQWATRERYVFDLFDRQLGRCLNYGSFSPTRARARSRCIACWMHRCSICDRVQDRGAIARGRKVTVSSKIIASCLGVLFATSMLGLAQARQFVCTAGTAYSSDIDGRLKTKEGVFRSNRTVFTVDTSSGLVQGDPVVPPGSYTVVYAGTGADGAKLLRSEAARLEVLFIATNAKSPYPFLFSDGVVTIGGTCRPSS